MAFFRSAIGGGGSSSTDVGTFKTSTSATTGYKVTTGFKPAYVCIIDANTSTPYNMIYNSDISTTKYNRGTVSANSWRNLETNTNAYSIKSIDNDGFTVFTASTYASHNWTYFAISE